MSKEDISEFKLVIKSFVAFLMWCIPYFIMGLPIIASVVYDTIWVVLLLPVSIMLGFFAKNALYIIQEND